MVENDFTLRPAQKSDSNAIGALLNREYYVHRHLDWRQPLEWLDSQPFWVLLHDGELHAALACPIDPPGIAWVHLFASSNIIQPVRAWPMLFQKILADFQANSPDYIVAIALQRWFRELLENNHFSHYQDIVVLNWTNQVPPARPLADDIDIRPMISSDLPAVAIIDQLAFEPIWRNSLEAIQLAYRQAAYSTVAVRNGTIVGFQISTASPLTTHLARLAVHPAMQHQNIGFALVYNLFGYFQRQGSWQLTVNTQHNNHSSLALYEKLGFERNGDSFPVLRYQP